MDNDERFNLTDQAVQDEPPVSPLDQLAAKHRELADTREVDIPVPGYDKQPPLLYIRYRLLEGNEIARMGDKIRRETRNQWQRQVFAAIDTFIAACKGFYCDQGDGLHNELMYQGEHLMGFNLKLAEALGFADELPDPATARAVAFSLFNNNDAAIAQHNFLLNAWFSDTSLDVQAELMGSF
jgi:hypothetical protein